eukprot:TRINITY_DN14427_c0_g1_i1.p1 TRINITY_DN14427_c0_g1~~TRINITY_DN14427_c0_g1_i1.p1  ORF type:complete len:1145 (+),score=222.29 TRINITY_DN14427_c0_g1_i1:29-3463(+)
MNPQEEFHNAASTGDIHACDSALAHGVSVNIEDDQGATALHFAAAGGHAKCVEFLVSRGAAVGARDITGLTPLHWAANEGHVAIALLLLHSGADVDSEDENKRTPLYWACDKDNGPFAKMLIERGSNVNHSDISFDTPLHWACARGREITSNILIASGANLNALNDKGSTPLLQSARATNVACLRLLLSKGASLSAATTRGNNALHVAAKANNAAAVVMLLDAGLELHSRGENGATPIHMAATSTDAATVRVLLERGSNIAAQDSDGKTALHKASERGNCDAAAELLNAGADIDAADKQAETPLHLAAANRYIDAVTLLVRAKANIEARNQFGQTPLHVAAHVQDNIEVTSYLLDHGASVGSTDNTGATCLHVSVAENNEQLFELLCARGASMNVRDVQGQTPLHLACTKSNTLLAESLLKAGADANAQNENGATPLHVVAEMGEKDLAELLIAYGAEVDVKDLVGTTPLALAARQGRTETAIMLIQKGAVEALMTRAVIAPPVSPSVTVPATVDSTPSSVRSDDIEIITGARSPDMAVPRPDVPYIATPQLRQHDVRTTPVSVNEWLHSLDMAEYLQQFLREEVDVRALPYLSEGDLITIGVDKIGQRRKMLQALKQLPLPRSPVDLDRLDEHDVTMVQTFLTQLNLAKYAMRFREEEIDFSTLAYLTEDDLIRMEMRIGGRRKILALRPIKESHLAASSAEQMALYRGRYRLKGEPIRGHSGEVRLAVEIVASRRVALKLHDNLESFRLEQDLLRTLSSEYVVGLFNSFEDSDAQSCLVLQRGDVLLSDLLKRGALERNEVKFVADRVAHALQLLHSRGLTFEGKMSTRNWMSFGARWKLIDLTQIVRGHEFSADLLSLGFFLLELITGRTIETVALALDATASLVDAQARSLLSILLRPDGDKCSIVSVLEHPFLRGGVDAGVNAQSLEKQLQMLTDLNAHLLRTVQAQHLSVSLQLFELRPTGGKLQPAVTVRAEHSLDSVFLLNVNTAYRMILTVSHNSASVLPIVACSRITVDGGHSGTSDQVGTPVALIPSAPLDTLRPNMFVFEATWDPREHNSALLSKLSHKNTAVPVGLVMELVVQGVSEPLRLTKVINVHMNEEGSDYKLKRWVQARRSNWQSQAPNWVQKLASANNVFTQFS